jgi:CRP-like cAMP-binding protein
MRRKRDTELGRTYPPGEPIVRQGDEGSCMYVIQAGTVEVIKEMDGTEMRLAVMGPGDFFGEMALFQDERRAATVRAIDDVRVVTIDKRTLLRQVEADPLLACNLVEVMSNRIRELHAKLAQSTQRTKP